MSGLTGSNASVINGINAANATSQANIANNTTNSNTAAGSQTALTGNLNTFLTMLTTQLKNQDPLSPMDSTQFTNQLVQFSAVEQQINTNSNLETLISLQKTSQQASAISYLGQTVSFSSSTLPLSSGASAFSYTLPSQAASLTVQIEDSSGAIVNTLTSPSGAAGTHDVSWDGTDSGGKQLPDGQYTIAITATDANGKAIIPTTAAYGIVTGVTSDSNGTELELGDSGMTTPLSGVLSIHSPVSNSGTGSTGTTGTTVSSASATPTPNGAGGTFSDGVGPGYATTAGSAVVTVNGPLGSATVDLSSRTLAQAAAIINGVQSSTGVTATVSGTSLAFTTTQTGAASLSGGTGDAAALDCTLAATTG